jgi:hypothetical protein
MDSIFDLLQPDKFPIDIVIIVLVLLAGEFQKKYMEDLKMKPALKTLVASSVFSLIYVVLFCLANGFDKQLPVRWFFSYTVATSLYELLLKKILNKLFGNDAKEPAKEEVL